MLAITSSISISIRPLPDIYKAYGAFGMDQFIPAVIKMSGGRQ